MKETVYIETSVVSYLVARPSRDLIVAARQQITLDWWNRSLNLYEAFVSPPVINESGRGDRKMSALRLGMLAGFKILEVNEDVRAISDIYLDRLNLPEKAETDCLHLALSSFHGMDYLLSWNCSHIVNANIIRALEGINADIGIRSPTICTPEELMKQ